MAPSLAMVMLSRAVLCPKQRELGVSVRPVVDAVDPHPRRWLACAREDGTGVDGRGR